MASAALEQLCLDKVLFMPTGNPRYRQRARASDAHRLRMLELALQGERRFELDTRELVAGHSGYTADTLAALRAERPGDRLFLLIGADQYAKLGSWHRPDEVQRLAELAVFVRPGWTIEGTARRIAFKPMDISASEVRARAARGEDISPFVPAAVANYIADNGLYR